MSNLVEEVFSLPSRLSPEGRAELIHRLLLELDETVDSPQLVAEAWDAEVSRRLAEIESGAMASIVAEDVWRRLLPGDALPPR